MHVVAAAPLVIDWRGLFSLAGQVFAAEISQDSQK